MSRRVTISTGNQQVASAGTAEALVATETLVERVIICAAAANTTAVFVGDSNVVAAADGTERGYPIEATGATGSNALDISANSDAIGLHGSSSGRKINLADIYVDAVTSADAVTWIAFA